MAESKLPVFSSDSKMKRYGIVFDKDVGQNRAAFFDPKFTTVKYNESFGDVYWTVEAGYEYRMDLVSNKFYGTAKYDWILEQVNNIKDPIKDLKIGTKLLIISTTRIISMV